ncbi:hypothetical protein LX36DRAFT_668548 [Colletotrichum falcatum]|nr:hypothetical protein LX36DRAFT_668548 [Colletotrichum falcatum]
MSFSAPYSYSTFSSDMDLDDPVADYLYFSSLFVSPPHTLPTEMDVDEEFHSSSSSQASQNPFSVQKCGPNRSSRSDGRPKNPFAGESARKRRGRRDNKAEAETKTQNQTRRRGGGEKQQGGEARDQRRHPKGAAMPEPKGQQRK